MTKRLFSVECEWSPDVANDEEFQALKRIFPSLRYKLADDMGSYEDRELSEEQKEAKKKARYKKYLAEWPKECTLGNERRSVIDVNLVDPMLFHFFKIIGPVEVSLEVPVNPSGMGWEEIAERMERAAARANTFNGSCNVHVGGGQLMQVNDLLLLESACTDTLQDALNKGWRIIACCVQPDGRRPDYVLGRYSEERRLECEAKLQGVGVGLARRDA